MFDIQKNPYVNDIALNPNREVQRLTWPPDT